MGISGVSVQRGVKRLRGNACLSLGVLALLAVLMSGMAGCQWTQSSFARMASNAGSAFAAAAATLAYAHEGKITYAYAASSFVNYRSQLHGLDQQIASASGAPDAHTVHSLLALYTPTMQALDHPCLSSSCDWRAQVATLDRASRAFLKASGP